MTTIVIKQHILKSVSYAMAKNEIRYYLDGVLIEHNGAETRLVATDGHRLHAALIEHPAGVLVDPVTAIMPRDFVLALCKVKGRKGVSPEIFLTIDGAKLEAALPDGTAISSPAIDGRFPDYPKTIPESFSGEVGAYRPDYILDAHKGVADFFGIKDHSMPFVQNGKGAGGISIPGFVAIAMPYIATEPCGIDTRFKSPIASPEKLQVAA